MREEIGLLCNGVSGDLELEKRKAREIREAWEHWKQRRLLAGDSIMVWVVPMHTKWPPGSPLNDPTNSQLSSQTYTSHTRTSDPWPQSSST